MPTETTGHIVFRLFFLQAPYLPTSGRRPNKTCARARTSIRLLRRSGEMVSTFPKSIAAWARAHDYRYVSHNYVPAVIKAGFPPNNPPSAGRGQPQVRRADRNLAWAPSDGPKQRAARITIPAARDCGAPQGRLQGGSILEKGRVFPRGTPCFVSAAILWAKKGGGNGGGRTNFVAGVKTLTASGNAWETMIR